MSIRLVESRVCDLHADYADGVVPVTIRLGDKERELDLCEEHADHLARWLDMDSEPVASTPVKKAPAKKAAAKRAVKKAPTKQVSGYAPARVVRQWAASQGIVVPATGRVPVEVVNQYLAATE